MNRVSPVPVRCWHTCGVVHTCFEHNLERFLLLLVVHQRASHTLEQLEATFGLHDSEVVDLSLLDNVVGIGAREAGTLEQADDLLLGDRLVVDKVLFFVATEAALEFHLVGFGALPRRERERERERERVRENE